MGGLNTNVKAQVLDWTGAVIPRLYAAGEITGGIHGTNRVGGTSYCSIARARSGSLMRTLPKRPLRHEFDALSHAY